MTITNPVDANIAGFQSMTSGGIWTGRTLTAGAGISITNGDGTAGNPVITATGMSGSGAIIQEVRAKVTSTDSAFGLNSNVYSTPTLVNTGPLISLSITPTSALNVIKVSFDTVATGNKGLGFYIFFGSTVISSWAYNCDGTFAVSPSFFDYFVSGTTAPTTLQVRWNSLGFGQLFNLYDGATPYFGGDVDMNLIATEVTP